MLATNVLDMLQQGNNVRQGKTESRFVLKNKNVSKYQAVKVSPGGSWARRLGTMGPKGCKMCEDTVQRVLRLSLDLDLDLILLNLDLDLIFKF